MPTYSPLQSIVITNNNTTSVTFSGIDQTYQDLRLVINMADNTSAGNMYLQFNGDTNTNYSCTGLYGNGSTQSSGRQTSTATSYILNDSTTSVGSTSIIVEMINYTNSATYKTYLTKQSDPARISVKVHQWRNNTDPIKSITLVSAYNLLARTTFDLYGISPVNAKVSAASGGTNIYYDSYYVYHVFTGSGTFTPSRALSADVLVIAGGGAGGINQGGGGGAGGIQLFSSQSLANNTNYSVIVGAAGTMLWDQNLKGGNGSNSIFGSLTASVGGGGGGSLGISDGASGGSGGGGAVGWYNFASANHSYGGGSTSGQGNPGGNGYDAGSYGNGPGGGGGGGGTSGGSATSSVAGNGGDGTYNSFTDAIGPLASIGQLSGGHYYFAGGGGGGAMTNSASSGTGGKGGGGTGHGTSSLAVSGSISTGGGGGGGSNNSQGTVGNNGGSGVVIVRYAR